MAAQITSSYSTGSVAGGSSSNLGGSIGYDNDLNNPNAKQYVYWDTDTSGTGYAAGNNGGSSDDGITGETTAQLTSGLPTGFGGTYWSEVANVNGGLPCLLGVTSGCH